MQIGAPMAAAYMLGHPDHYTSHHFKKVYWKPYVQEVLSHFPQSQTNDYGDERLIGICKKKGEYYKVDIVQDYVMRPNQIEDVTLYDWLTLYDKVHMTGKLPVGGIAECEDETEISLTESVKLNLPPCKSNSTGNFLTFLSGHPQSGTYKINV